MREIWSSEKSKCNPGQARHGALCNTTRRPRWARRRTIAENQTLFGTVALKREGDESTRCRDEEKKSILVAFLRVFENEERKVCGRFWRRNR